MKLGSNNRAARTLLALLLTVVIIFLIEKKLLVSELRGETVSRYDKIKWTSKILLLVEDFEGFKTDSASIIQQGFFSYGNAKIALDTVQVDDKSIASKTSLKIEWSGTENYGGWGKGVGKNIDLTTSTDYLNFRIYVPKINGGTGNIKIVLEEDDNNDGVLQKESDDSWFYRINIEAKDEWQFISIPLKDFADNNSGGDSLLNVSRKGGLHTIIFSFEEVEKYTNKHTWYFDFICFTNEKVISSEIE